MNTVEHVEPIKTIEHNQHVEPIKTIEPNQHVGTTTSADSPVETIEPTQQVVKPIKIIIIPNADWSFMDIVTKAIPPGWKSVFEKNHREFKDINKTLKLKSPTFFPQNKDVFRVFQRCPLKCVKVVILGQDPYHSTNRSGQPIANGIAFSVNPGNPVPPSLKNIYKEILRDYSNFGMPVHGDLTKWVNQGVFMLNTCLTVAPHKPGSHGASLWRGFIEDVLKTINHTHSNCIYVLWGDKAKKMGNVLRGKPIILKSSHPSPFSYSRGFAGCHHFKQINDLLIDMNKTPIDWTL